MLQKKADYIVKLVDNKKRPEFSGLFVFKGDIVTNLFKFNKSLFIKLKAYIFLKIA